MLRAVQQDIAIILDPIEIDLEFLSVKLRDNRFITESEVRKILYFSENIGKPLNEK
jgi:hypothetical protein